MHPAPGASVPPPRVLSLRVVSLRVPPLRDCRSLIRSTAVHISLFSSSLANLTLSCQYIFFCTVFPVFLAQTCLAKVFFALAVRIVPESTPQRASSLARYPSRQRRKLPTFVFTRYTTSMLSTTSLKFAAFAAAILHSVFAVCLVPVHASTENGPAVHSGALFPHGAVKTPSKSPRVCVVRMLRQLLMLGSSWEAVDCRSGGARQIYRRGC